MKLFDFRNTLEYLQNATGGNIFDVHGSCGRSLGFWIVGVFDLSKANVEDDRKQTPNVVPGKKTTPSTKSYTI